MSEAGGLESTDFRLGFHKPLDRPWRPVIYAAVNLNDTLYAVLDACIIIGTVAEQEEVVRRIRQNNNNPRLFSDPGFQMLGAAIKGASYRWSNRRVPYEIAWNLPNQQRVHDAIAHWHANTKLFFDNKTPADQDWVVFIPSTGCASSVGRQGGMQRIFLGDACSTGNAIHEIGHTVGFYHEQSRSDRDSFVEIKWQNINSAYRHNFDLEDSLNFGGYDFGSIMHYPGDAFSVNSQDTIVPRAPLPPGIVMGQRAGLSPGDIAAVAALYP